MWVCLMDTVSHQSCQKQDRDGADQGRHRAATRAKLSRQDSHLAAGPNKITLNCRRSSITRPRSEPQAPPIHAPSPRPNSLHIQQLAPVTPVRRPRGESREALTSRRCPRSAVQGPWTTDLGAWILALGPWSRVQARLQVRF